jgi:hypothetical protein
MRIPRKISIAFMAAISLAVSGINANALQDYQIDGWNLYPPDAGGSSEAKINEALDIMAGSYPGGAGYKDMIDQGLVKIGEMAPGDNPNNLEANGTHDKDTV